MRTTLDIDEDVLQAVKELAAATGRTAGQVVSDLARKGLAPAAGGPPVSRNGVPVLSTRGTDASRVTMRRIEQLRDDG